MVGPTISPARVSVDGKFFRLGEKKFVDRVWRMSFAPTRRAIRSHAQTAARDLDHICELAPT